MTMSDALFLAAHPSWSHRDLMEADQDIIDLLAAIQYEGAMHSQREAQQHEREAAAANHRARLRAR